LSGDDFIKQFEDENSDHSCVTTPIYGIRGFLLTPNTDENKAVVKNNKRSRAKITCEKT
jgi:hypothetical protein